MQYIFFFVNKQYVLNEHPQWLIKIHKHDLCTVC